MKINRRAKANTRNVNFVISSRGILTLNNLLKPNFSITTNESPFWDSKDNAIQNVAYFFAILFLVFLLLLCFFFY